jgi:hypothetical protein
LVQKTGDNTARTLYMISSAKLNNFLGAEHLECSNVSYNADVGHAQGRKSAVLCIQVGHVAATENRVHIDSLRAI